MPRKKAEGGRTLFTTFTLARELGVSPPTVVNWVNSGLLAAHTTPGGHRRMQLEDIVVFCKEHGIPLPPSLEQDQTKAAAPASSGARGGVPSSGPHRLLVVDNEPEFCTMVREYFLLRGGYEVEVADSGFAAGYAVAQFKPQAILMDILMDDMDGFEVLRMLQADPETRAIPVIACTAWRDPRVEERVKKEAFVGFIEKPLRLDRLAEVVASAINGRSPRG